MAIITTNGTGLFTGLADGNYSVGVDDGNTCGVLSTGPLTIIEPKVLAMTTFKNDLSCNGDLSGEILVVA